MDRLTHKRCNGIKDGYWSPAKKEELVQRLAAYENTGLEPEKIQQIDQLYQELSKEVMQFRKNMARMRDEKWIPVEERLPKMGLKVLITNGEFVKEGYLRPDGVWKYGMDTEAVFSKLSCVGVIAWQPLPEPYHPQENDDKKKVIPPAPASWRYHMERRFQKRT